MKNSLNRAYRLVWNEATGTYVAVAETTRARGKRASGAVRAAATGLLVALASHAAWALDPGTLPRGANVAAGSAGFTQSGNALNVQQSSQKLVINWGSFDIGSAASVNFSQPSSSAIALNRVSSGVPTQIEGALNANGNVWVLNSAGVVFGKTAQVNVGGLVASSLTLSDGDFQSGRYTFSNDSGAAGTVSNAGSINARGGVVALVAPVVRNSGSIAASTVALAAGDQVTLDFKGDGLLSYTIDRAALGALVENSGSISGDTVSLSARSASAAVATVVNNEGVIEATGLSESGGHIVLDGGDNGAVHVAGTLDASSAAAQGGSITVTGHAITLDGGATLAADGATGGGSIHVGGGYQGKDTSLLNATTVSADSSVTASASATANGNGGEVVFWSDDHTSFAGRIGIRGGVQGGDGGRAEVSGKETLNYSGLTDASAAKGATGNLLLDPSTITINGGSGTNASDGSVLYASNLEAQTANVYLLASGNVTVTDLDLNGGNGKLTMQNNVGLRIDSSTGIIKFNDPTNTIEVSGTGYIYLQVTRSGSLSNIGNLVASGPGVAAATGFFTGGVSDGVGTPAAGSITLFGSEGVTLGGSVTTNGGYVRIWADANNGGGGSLTLAKPITTNGGNLYLSTGTGGINMNSDMTLGTGRITFGADGTHTTGTNVLNGLLSASGDISISQSLQFGAGAGISTDGRLTISSASSMTGSGASLTLTASSFDLQQAIAGNSGTVTLKPYLAGTNVDIGAAGSGNMLIDTNALSKLSGFSNIIIGRNDGTGTTSVNADTSVAAAGRIELINQTLNVNGGALTNTTGDVTLTGNTLSIGNTVNAKGGTGKITLRPLAAGALVDVGGSTINTALLNQLQAATLEIGSSTSGDLTFSSDIATTATTVNLISGGNITATAGGVSAPHLVATAGGSVTISDSTFDFSTLSLTTGVNSSSSVTSSSAIWGTTSLNLGAGSSTTLTAASSLDLGGTINFNSGATTLALLSNAFTGTPTSSNKTLAGVTFDVIDHGNTLTVGAASSTLPGTTLSGFSGTKNITIGSAGTEVSTEAALNIATAAGGQLKLVGSHVNVGDDISVTVGSLALDSGNTLNIGHALTATDTVSLTTNNADIDGGSNGVITTNHLMVDIGGGDLSLATVQQVNTLSATGHNVALINGKSLVVNGVDASGLVGLWASGSSSDLTLAGTVSADSAGQAGGQMSMVLIADRNFINNVGSTVLDAGAGTWRVYSTSPLNDTRNGLTPDFKQYNANYFDGTVLGSGNGFFYSVAPTLTVGLTGTISKTYDGNTGASLANATLNATGAIDGDHVVVTASGASYDTKDAGTSKTVTASGVEFSASNGAMPVYGYTIAAPVTGTGVITPRTVSLSGSKTYDGTTALSGSNVTIGNLVDGETLGYSGATASDAHVATAGKYIDGITLTNGSGLASNYALPTLDAANAAVTITPATIAATAAIVGATSKTYDGTTAATGAGISGTATGVAGDVLVLDTSSVTLAYDSAHVVDASHIGATGSVGYMIASSSHGSQASDYVFTAPTLAAVDAGISAKAISAGAVSVAGKVYDGSTVANVSGGALSGVIEGDNVSTTLSGQYDNKNKGTGKDVTVTLGLSGSSTSDYVLETTTVHASGDIAAKTVDVGAISVATKFYDGTTAAIVSGGALTGVIAGEDVTTTLSGSYADPSAGIGKTVTVTLGLSGADAGNYQLSATQVTVSGSIGGNPAANAVSALQVQPNSSNGTQQSTTVNGSIADASTGSTLLPGTSGQAQLFGGSDARGSATPASSGNASPLQPAVQLSSEGEFRTAEGVSVATPAGPNDAPAQSKLAVFVADAGAGLSYQGQYEALDQAGSLSLLRQAGQPAGQPQLDGAVTLRTEATLGDARIELSLLSTGSLVVQVPSELATMSRDTLSAYALSALKASTSTGVDKVNAIVLRFVK
ncbi:YDG domain-containing protein [Paucibacter sp. R3-3]|uniref:YDG domain-containing protein n=1 Tax=Roseateles agri TaxID=3098619 RepID=A0ABU5DQT9_9BURK|nr:YDG domain-containing protein [Paucibacter sp. R3-3]MDY0748687.1 YDG domain-containing protein [Paucibacter sp. R3-3]